MWHPFYNGPVLTPLLLHYESAVEAPRLPAAVLSWPPAVPVNQTLASWGGFPAFPKAAKSSDEAKVFVMQRSLFDLIKGPAIMEMTDQKLLGWYLSLPVEDRHIINEQGGLRAFLQKHPALEVMRELVFVKDEIKGVHRAEEIQALTDTPQCSSCSASGSFSAASVCRQCSKAVANPQEGALEGVDVKELILLHENLKKEPDLCGSGGSVMDEAGMAIHQQAAAPLSADCLLALQDSCHSARKSRNVTETHPGQKEVARSQPEEPSDQCDCSSTKWMDVDNIGSARSEDDQMREPFAQGAMEVFQWTSEQKDHAESVEDLTDLQHPEFGGVDEAGFGQKCIEGASQSAREERFACTAQDEASSRATAYERFLAVDGKVPMNQSETVNGDLKGDVMSSGDLQSSRRKKFSSLEAQIVQCDAAVSTDISTWDQSVQTLPVPSAEKFTITDVYMADLDYFKQEFIRLKLVEVEVVTLKDKLKSLEGQERGLCCGGAQRAVHAELSLLALQHAMCQQYCWGCYCTSAEGSRFLLGKNVLPESMIEVLQILEDDYQEMRKMILSGVPLEQLRPLSVDCQKIASEGCHIPAEEMKSVPENKSCFFEGSVVTECSGGGGHGLEGGTGTPPQEGLNEKTEAISHQDTRQSGKDGALQVRTAGAPEPESSTNKGRHEGEKFHSKPAENDGEIPAKGFCHEQEMDRYFPGVKEFPNDASENNVDQFGAHQPSGTKMATSVKNVRTACVSEQSPSAAERAVGDLSGCTVRGRPAEMGQTPDTGSCRSVDHTQGSKHDMSAFVAKGLSQPLEKLVNVQESPTSTGIYVPRRSVADGFGPLMAQLSLRHPGLAQRSIIKALLELLARHHGFLSDLPPETVVEMTSSLLKRAPQNRNEDPK